MAFPEFLGYGEVINTPPIVGQHAAGPRRLIGLSEDFPRIVCLCGSTRFTEEFQRQNLNLTLQGHIVLTIGANVADQSLGIAQDSAVKGALDMLHLRKIDLADEVLVLNVKGYIGLSTAREIAYAKKIGKPLHYLEPT